MRTRISLPLSGLLLGLAISGCAAVSGGGDGVAGSSPRAQTELVVVNHNWQDVVVYAVAAGTRWRLGNVNSMRTHTFRIPSEVVGASGNVQLFVDPIGSRQGYLTDRILIRPGDRVRWTIENALTLSSYSVMHRRH